MHIAGHLLQNDADSRKAKARLTHKPGDKGHWLGIRIRTDCASLGLNQDPLCMCGCVVVEDCTGKERCIILHLTLPPKLARTILAINFARTRFFLQKCTDRTPLSILIRNLVYGPCRENLCVVQALLCILHIFLISSPVQHFCAA